MLNFPDWLNLVRHTQYYRLLKLHEILNFDIPFSDTLRNSAYLTTPSLYLLDLVSSAHFHLPVRGSKPHQPIRYARNFPATAAHQSDFYREGQPIK